MIKGIKGFYTNYSYVAYVDEDTDDTIEFVSDEEAINFFKEEDDE